MQSYTKDIQFNLIVPNVRISNHKQALSSLAKNAAEYLNISEKTLHTRITEKEKISNSAIGDGIAMPNVKMRRVRTPFTMLMTIDKSIHHETPDNAPITMYGLLISPADDGPIHLRRLSRVSRLLLNESIRTRINETKDKQLTQS